MSRAQLLRGAPLAAALGSDIATAVDVLVGAAGLRPLLATVLVGANPPAAAYRRSIVRSLATVGIEHRAVDLGEETTAESLVTTIRRLNDDAAVSGILVLMPLPPSLDSHLVLEELSPLKDVDGITPTNAGRLHLGLPALRPSTPQGGIELLDHYGYQVAGQHVVVVGRSNVVGRPLATMLTLRNATVTLCHRQTRDLAALIRQADVVAVAAGHPRLITADLVRFGAIVLDFGVNVVDGKLVGDVDLESVGRVARAVTPVPGGTGPVTAMILARNVVAAGYASLRGSPHAVDLPASP